MSKDDFFAECQVVNKHVFETVQKYGGSVSAEHGVGMTKKPYLQYSRSETEINYLRDIKKVFDPNNIMNRGNMFRHIAAPHQAFLIIQGFLSVLLVVAMILLYL